MNFFAAAKKADFAKKVFAAAGLDFEAAFAANDAEALKNKLALAKAEAEQAAGSGAEDLAAFQESLTEATAENSALSAKLDTIHAELEKAGIDAYAKPADAAADAEPVFSADKLRAELEARASVKAREILAASGSAPLADAPVADANRGAASKQKELTHAEFSALTPGEKMKFCRSGGRVTELPVAKK